MDMEKKLTLLTWPNYIDPRTIQMFEHEFGAKVELVIVPSAAELVDRVMAGDSPDILCPPDYAVRELSAHGLLSSLDRSMLPNLMHLEPRFQMGRAHDPASQVSIIKDWGTTGFMYRMDMIEDKLNSWQDFWRISTSPICSGKVTVLDSPGEVIGAALKMRGRSYNASSPDELEQARNDLMNLKPNLFAFETDYKPLLASGAACMSLGWNGDAAVLIAQGVPIKYIVPVEGSQLWEDDWAVSAGAPHSELAHTFLNFVLRPEIAAQEARYTRYATGNRTALSLLEDEITNDPSTYPSEDMLQKLESGMPLDEEGQRRREELWAAVKG